MRPINEIIVHCTATKPDWMSGSTTEEKVDEVKRWHVIDRGWKDIGYHYLIDRDGTIATGRPIDQVGAHTQGHNTGSIGISLIGGFGSSADDKFEENFTPKQEFALRKLIEDLRYRFGVKKISGHNEYANKACPGFRVAKWLGSEPQKPDRKNVAQSSTVQASAVQIASGAGAGVAAVGALDGTAQIVALAFCGIIVLAAVWIMRERIKKWSEGVR